jgi:rhomboid protease GluP
MGVADTCPYCGAPRAKALVGISKIFRSASQRGVLATELIFYFCIFIFAVSLLITFGFTGFSGMISAIMTPPSATLYLLGLNSPAVFQGAWWGPILACFLHIGIFHIAFNLYALKMLGNLFEPVVGPKSFFTIFLLSGIGGMLLAAQNGVVSAGASGGIMGLIGAGMVIIYFRGGGYRDPVFQGLLQWLIYIGLFGVFAPMLGLRIDNWGHFGGLVSGAALGYLWQSRATKKAFDSLAKVFTYIGIISIPIAYYFCVSNILPQLMN